MEQRQKAVTDMELGMDMMPEEQKMFKMANEHWKRFSKTGSVADYLDYVAFARGGQMPTDLK